ncbi:MAG TPA: molybdopterin molybdotransferase MoeA [Intrasporangiaceae bacterium]|nr:molybdopterin molybdotransferase MoeA [Intrasporangiaceae bacterium]
MRPVEDHLAAILATVSPTPTVDLALRDALGATLAEPVRSAVDLPGFTNSAMDGYAVRAADCAGASTSSPVRLPVVGDIQAGDTSPRTLEPGACWRIMTGAPMPEGADAVVPVEDSDGGTETVALTAAPDLHRHVRFRGEDVAAGAQVLAAGAVLTPGRLALVAAANVATVRANTPPRVAIISTGDELREPGSELAHGQIVDSNSLMLEALVRASGVEPVRLPRSRDDVDSLTRALTEAAAAADLVLTTGGVSMGAYDTVKEVLSRSGTVEFAKVAMRPGMPQGHGVIGPRATPIITLPGNPLSAMVSFHVFVLPAIAALQGRPVDAANWRAPAVPGRAAVAWPSVPDKVEFTRVTLRRGIATPSGGQGSHMVGALADANAIAIIPADVTQVQEGDVVQCLRLVGTIPANNAAGEVSML